MSCCLANTKEAVRPESHADCGVTAAVCEIGHGDTRTVLSHSQEPNEESKDEAFSLTHSACPLVIACSIGLVCTGLPYIVRSIVIGTAPRI